MSQPTTFRVCLETIATLRHALAEAEKELAAAQKKHAGCDGVINDLRNEVLRLQAELHDMRNVATVETLRASR